MKKFLSLLAACLLCFSMIQGIALAEAPVEITFWHSLTGVQLEAINESVTMFNDSHPSIHVNAEYVGSSGGANTGVTDKVIVAINGGNPPDCVYFDRFQVAQWANEGLLTDVTEQMEKNGLSAKDFYDYAWMEVEWNDRIYGFPEEIDCRGLFYNIDHLAEAGYTEPPKTIEQLAEYNEKLTIMNGNLYSRIGFIPWLDQGNILTWALAFGGTPYDYENSRVTVNDPKIVEACEWMADWARIHDVETITDFTSATTGGDFKPFSAGIVSMYISGTWDVAGIRAQNPNINFGVVPVPTPTGEDNKCYGGGWCYIIPAGVPQEKIDAVSEFALYMTVGEGAAYISNKCGRFLANIELNQSATWHQGDAAYEAFINMFSQTYARPVIAQGASFWYELKANLEKVVQGVDTPQNILDGITNKINAMIDESVTK